MSIRLFFIICYWKIEIVLDQFLYKHFSLVSTEEKFLSLSVDDVISLLTGGELSVSNKEEIFESIICWLQHDLSKAVYSTRY